MLGLGAGASIGQLFEFVLAGVAMAEVGSASGVLGATQQASTFGVAVLGTAFFSDLTHAHQPSDALATTTWACLIPLAITFALVFRRPMKARE